MATTVQCAHIYVSSICFIRLKLSDLKEYNTFLTSQTSVQVMKIHAPISSKLEFVQTYSNLSLMMLESRVK